MQKINIIAHRNFRDGILDFLQENALMQVIDLEEELKKTLAPIFKEERRDFDYLLAEVQFAIEFLERYKKKEKRNFLQKLLTLQPQLTSKEFDKVVKTFYFKDIVERCKNLEEEINNLDSQKSKIEEEKQLLFSWRNLDIPLVQLEGTDKIAITTGSVVLKNFDDLTEDLTKSSKLVHFQEIAQRENERLLLIISSREVEKKVEKILQKYEFTKIALPRKKGTPREELASLKEKLAQINKELREEKKKASGLVKYQFKLRVIYDYLLWRKISQEAQARMGSTSDTFVLSGWIIEENYDKLKRGLDKITRGNVEIIRMKPRKGELVPVVIQNRPFLRPLESVTTIYGLPLPHEIDPTPYLAPFFILFFGLCMGDAGYGIAVVALAWLVMTILRVPKENQGLFRVLIYGGIVTFIVGILLGGWFGIDLEILPAFISQPLTLLRQLDPIKNPVALLILSLGLGVVQVWTGIAINFYWKIRQKNYKEAFLGPLPWLYFFAAIIFWALCNFGILSESLAQPAYYTLLAGLAGLVLTQGYRQKKIFLKLASGVMSLYGLVGYLSDILSYARILALGLSTAVIAMVVNLVAVMFRDMIPILGWAVMVLILFGGHLFNIAISGLSGFIHSARLQFVEFFPKFMEGGGEKFEPLRREHKYVTLRSEKS